jgi:hypothetical protein
MWSFTTRRWALVACVVGASTITLAAVRHHALPPVPVRPAVALFMSIDATEYLTKLDDPTCTRDCRALRDALAESTFAIVRTAYPFLNWDDAAHATDTVNLRLTSKGISAPWSLIEFRIRAPQPRMQPERLLVDFEPYDDFKERDLRDDWSIDSLRRQWVRRMRAKLTNPNLVETVFGRIPINAPVKITGTVGHVGVRGRSIYQANYERPAFDVTTQVSDPVTGSDQVVIRLNPCRGIGEPDYNCDVARIIYPSRDTLTGARLATLLGRASFAPSSQVRLVLFRADKEHSGLQGATWH